MTCCNVEGLHSLVCSRLALDIMTFTTSLITGYDFYLLSESPDLILLALFLVDLILIYHLQFFNNDPGVNVCVLFFRMGLL